MSQTKMSVKSDAVPWDDIKKAALPVAVPIGILGAGWYYFMQQKDQQAWFKSLKKPSWMIENSQIVAVIDLAAIAPIGYAAHLVCKEARGNDRQIAFGLYGAGLLALIAGIPAYSRTKDLKCWFGVATLGSALFGATAFAFYKLNNTAGLLLVPWVAWSIYGAISLAGMLQANPKAGKDWAPKK